MCAGAALVALAGGIAMYRATGEPRPGGSGGRVIPPGRFVFLHVYEASTHALRAPLPASVPERVGWNEQTRSMFVPAPEDRPRPSTQVYVLGDLRSGFRRIGARIEHVAALPHRYDVRAAFAPPGQLRLADGTAPPADLIDDRQRLVDGDLELLVLTAEGTVEGRLGGRPFRLRPGDELRLGWWRDPDGVIHAFDGNQGWKAEIERALANGWPLTTLIVANLGLWEHGRVTGP